VLPPGIDAEINMKLYGYGSEVHGHRGLMELSEVTMQAGSEELRAIAGFFADLATEVEMSDFDHAHLCDRISAFSSGPQFIVVKEDK
jgi:hypothetical protein